MLPIPIIHLTPQQLDLQCPVQIAEWLELNSPQAKEIDNNPAITIRWLRIGVDAGYMFRDSLGRIWGKGSAERIWYPYHLDAYGKKYGLRVSTQASN